MGYLYSVCYVPQAIRTSLEVLMALNPKDEYPEARPWTATSFFTWAAPAPAKPYAGFQRLKQARTGGIWPSAPAGLEAQEGFAGCRHRLQPHHR